jgi:hypothetical protein
MQSTEKISITLPPDMLRLIREAVAAGSGARRFGVFEMTRIRHFWLH